MGWKRRLCVRKCWHVGTGVSSVDWLIDWFEEPSHILWAYFYRPGSLCVLLVLATLHAIDLILKESHKKRRLTSDQMRPKESRSQSGGFLFRLCQILRCRLGFSLGHSLSLLPGELQGYTKLMVDCLPVTEGRLKGASYRVESSCSCFCSKCVLDISPKRIERTIFSVFCFQACQFRFFRKPHKDTSDGAPSHHFTSHHQGQWKGLFFALDNADGIFQAKTQAESELKV